MSARNENVEFFYRNIRYALNEMPSFLNVIFCNFLAYDIEKSIKKLANNLEKSMT